MHIDSSVTSLSWIPSEAVTGLNKAVFDSGVTHYDEPPPDAIADIAAIEALRDADRFRFVNRLSAWAEFDGDSAVASGYSGRGYMGATTVRLGSHDLVTFAAPSLPDLQREPEVGDGWVRFVQTAGGRTALPAPRRVKHPPFVQFQAPLVWTTLALTLHADGRAEHEVVGASTFPRHWIYDATGNLTAKVGLADFKDWWRRSFGNHTPWGDKESPTLVTAIETALERELADAIMRGGEKPAVRNVKQGNVLVEQGTPGADIFLLLDGVLSVEVAGEALAEVGPGAIIGERAILECGLRTSTLRAATNVRVAVATAAQVDVDKLRELSSGHRREDARVDPSSGVLDT